MQLFDHLGMYLDTQNEVGRYSAIFRHANSQHLLLTNKRNVII